jgi:predicted DNA-binding protein (MmcQ/YjbR family)
MLTSAAKIDAFVRKAALGYPETREDHPWGESAFKVRGKVFCFLSQHDGNLNFTVKLPERHLFACELPGVAPTGYGLGKSGWVTLKLAPGEAADTQMLLDWLDESFRAVAPKAVIKALR